MIDKRFGVYEIAGKIGRGGMRETQLTENLYNIGFRCAQTAE